MLHLIAALPAEPAVLQRIGANDAILLFDAAVCSAKSGHALTEQWQTLLNNGCRLYLLQPHLAVFGLETANLMAGIEPVDFAGWVELTTAHPVIQTWN